jgi:O-antigen/teichoic acid export membrane protein
VIGETLQKVGKQAAVYGFGDLLVKSLSFLLIPVLTRVWASDGPDMGLYGLLHLAEAVAYLLFNLGLVTAVIKVLADYKHGRSRGSVVFTALTLLGTLSLTLFALLWAAAPTLAGLLFGRASFPYDGTLLLRLTLLATYLSTFRFVALSLLRVEGRPWRHTLLNLINFLTYVSVAIFLVVVEDQGVQGIVYANLTASVVMLAVVASLLQARARRPFSASKARKLLAFGLPLLPNGLALWGLTLLDRVLLLHLSPGADELARLAITGQYDVAYRFGMIVSFLLVIPLRSAWVPAIYTVREHPDAPRLYGRLLTYVVGAGGAIALALGVFSREIITLVAEPEWIAAARPLPLIAFAYVCYGISQIVDTGILASGRTAVYPLVTLSSVAVNVGLCVLLIPDMGMMGAAWATLAAYAWHALLLGRVSHAIAPFHPEWRRLLLITAVGATVWFGAGLIPEWGLWARIAAKAGVLALYPVMLWLSGFLSAGELEALKNLRGSHRGQREDGPEESE